MSPSMDSHLYGFGYAQIYVYMTYIYIVCLAVIPKFESSSDGSMLYFSSHGCSSLAWIYFVLVYNHGYQNTTQTHVKKTQTWTQLPTIQCILCHTDANLSTTITIKMWIHARTHTNTPLQPRESNEHLTDTQGLRIVFNKVRFYPCDYNVLMSNMVETT